MGSPPVFWERCIHYCSDPYRRMPRYFFHIHQNGELSKDDEGTDLNNFESVRMEAMRVIPEIARHEVPRDGDRQAYTVLVTDEDGVSVYSATLTFAGLWLL